MKIACILRVADAAHIDHRRAPRFLWALVKPSGVAAQHWSFQNKLGKPHPDGDNIIYASGKSFTHDEADAWWLCYDMINMIDRELQETAAVLRNRKDYVPFAIRRVKGAGSPAATAELIRPAGWTPVDTALRVSDVPRLISMLGGRRLYGNDPSVALRELIQNAADAVRARRLLTDKDRSYGKIDVRLSKCDGAHWLHVTDDGVGMSRFILTEVLIDFGRSIWTSGIVKQEFPGLLAKGISPTGRFGIGFYSAFILGARILVSTKRYDQGVDKNMVLDFREGLNFRPILREPDASEFMTDGGTRVSIQLAKTPNEVGGLLSQKTLLGHEPISLSTLVGLVCPGLDVDIQVEEYGNKEIAASACDWNRIPSENLLSRVSGKEKKSISYDEASRVRELRRGGDILGRACISLSQLSEATVSIGGFRAMGIGRLSGMLLADEPSTVVRNTAWPSVDFQTLQAWATEQAKLISSSQIPAHKKCDAASVILLFKGEIGDLPVGRREGVYVNIDEILQKTTASDDIIIYRGIEVDYDEYDDEDVSPKSFSKYFEEDDDVLFLRSDCEYLAKIDGKIWPKDVAGYAEYGAKNNFLDLIIERIAEKFGIAAEGIDVIVQEDRVGEVKDKEIRRNTLVIRLPQ